MNPKYAPKTPEARMSRLVEEIGEVMTESGDLLKALGKAGRFGIHSTSPAGGPSNFEIILKTFSKLRLEMADLDGAIQAVEADLLDQAIDEAYARAHPREAA